MADKDTRDTPDGARAPERRSPRTVLLVGAGRRAKEVGTVLSALSALEPLQGEKTREPLPELGVGDLEELLAQRPVEGLLILESGRVPGEDIGFVRRFLERHAGWRLLVIGEDSQDARVRPLLTLTRAQWLAWPPDLEQLRALLGPEVPRAEAATNGTREPPTPAPARRPARRAPAHTEGGVDLGDLLEELLAGAALQGEGTPRYQYRRGETFLVQRERGPLSEGLGGLVELARRCAGSDGLVRAGIDPAGDALLIGIDFPRSSLSEKDLPGLFERPPAPGSDPELTAGLLAAQHGVARLGEVGGRVELRASEPGRLRCEVRLHSAALAPLPKGARSGKPEDPFA